MMPRALIDIELNFLQWGFAFVVDFEWKNTAIVFGPIAISTSLGFHWKLDQYQPLFGFNFIRNKE